MNRKLLLNTAPWLFWPVVLITCANAQVKKTFPDGPGKQVVEQVCVQCHEPAYLLRQHRTEGYWKRIVARMAPMSQKVAGGPTAADYDAVAAYLFANFGKPGPDVEPVAIQAPEEPAGGGRGRGGRGGGAAAGGAAAGGRGGGGAGARASGDRVAAKTIDDFPDGPGKQFVQQICMQCHEATFLFQQHRAEENWKTTVARMSKKGLGGPPENYDAAAAYMAKNFGPEVIAEKVNINTASADDIVAKLGLTKEEATALVGYRTKNGDFHEWGDMLVIYGIDGHKIKAVKDRLSY